MTFHQAATKHSPTAQWTPVHRFNPQQMLEHAAARGYIRTNTGTVYQLLKWATKGRHHTRIRVTNEHGTPITLPKTRCVDVWTETATLTPQRESPGAVLPARDTTRNQ